MSEPRRTLHTALRAVLTSLVGLAALLGAEILIARRAPHIEPFTRAQLDGPYGDASGPSVRLVWIGDSTGVGVGASEPQRALPALVAEGLGGRVELFVLARSGARVADALTDQLPQLASLRPDVVIVAIGNNDVVHVTRRRAFRARLERLLAGVRDAGPSRIAVLGVGEFASTPLFWQPLRAIAGKRADALNGDVRALAEKHGAVFVDIKAQTGPAFVADPRRYHAHDGFHPSDAGYRLWADATLDAVRKARR